MSTSKTNKMKVRINFDGSCRGNSNSDSKCGIGVAVFFDEIYQNIPHSHSSRLPDGKTNNESEWLALCQAAAHASYYLRTIKDSVVEIQGDSKLVINQITDKWKVRDPNLQRYYNLCKSTLAQFPQVTFTHVLRHLNREADRLANLCLDKVDPIIEKEIITSDQLYFEFLEASVEEEQLQEVSRLDTARDLMISRGYLPLSNNETNTSMFLTKDINEVTLSAVVQLGIKDTVTLCNLQLPRRLEIKTSEITLTDMSFEKLESLVLYYSKICLEHPPF